uniref:Uncharacterized protein n=1 Tax=Nothoprocta perdicaria TaxID=30464 RepID=A0A8C6ZJS6_NOTPE
MASGTALIYDEEMTSHKLLWNDPICDIEVPERLSSSYEQLERYHLVERCVRVPAREASEEEILLVHRSEICFPHLSDSFSEITDPLPPDHKNLI